MPQFTLEPGRRLRAEDRLDNGEKIMMNFQLDVPDVTNVADGAHDRHAAWRAPTSRSSS